MTTPTASLTGMTATGPIVLGALLGKLAWYLRGSELSEFIGVIGMLVGAALMALGLPWFGVAIYRLARWDQTREAVGKVTGAPAGPRCR